MSHRAQACRGTPARGQLGRTISAGPLIVPATIVAEACYMITRYRFGSPSTNISRIGSGRIDGPAEQ